MEKNIYVISHDGKEYASVKLNHFAEHQKLHCESNMSVKRWTCSIKGIRDKVICESLKRPWEVCPCGLIGFHWLGVFHQRLAIFTGSGQTQIQNLNKENKVYGGRGSERHATDSVTAHRKTIKTIRTREMCLPAGKTNFAHAESLPGYLCQKDSCWTRWQSEELFPLSHSGKTAKKTLLEWISAKESKGLAGGGSAY